MIMTARLRRDFPASPCGRLFAKSRGLRLSNASGSAAIEFALILPLLLLILAGVVDLVMLADLAAQIANAARAGVQYGAQNSVTAGDNTGIQNAAMNDASSIAPAKWLFTDTTPLCACSSSQGITGLDRCITVESTCTASGARVIKYARVDFSVDYSPLIPGMELLWPSRLDAHAVMQVVGQY
jgi:Flp pilus assembly protein TadG